MDNIKSDAATNGLLVSISAISLYLIIVVLTTPSLPARTSVLVALETNWLMLLGIAVGVGIQANLLSYGGATCGIKRHRQISGASGLASGFSSLVSMFSLVSVGCCGTWLYLLSFLPGLLGTGASALLVGYSMIFVIAGFLVMGASVAYTYLQISAARKLNQSTLAEKGNAF